MRDLPLRFLHMLGDRAAQADDRHLLDTVAPRRPARDAAGAARRARGDIGVEVLVRDAAARPGAGHELQFDAEIPGAPPHRRRGERLLPRTARDRDRSGTQSGRLPLTLPRRQRGPSLSSRAGRGRLRRLRLPDSVAAGPHPSPRLRGEGRGEGLGRLTPALVEPVRRQSPPSTLPSPSDIEHHQFRADRAPFAGLAVDRDDRAGDRRRISTVALSVIMSASCWSSSTCRLTFDVPGDDLGLGNAFADVGQLE